MHTTHELTSNDRTQAQERHEQALTRAYSSFSTLDTVSTLDSRLLYEQTPTADDATTLHHSIIITATIPSLPPAILSSWLRRSPHLVQILGRGCVTPRHCCSAPWRWCAPAPKPSQSILLAADPERLATFPAPQSSSWANSMSSMWPRIRATARSSSMTMPPSNQWATRALGTSRRS